MRIADGGDVGVSASREHLVFAYYVTGHGFGHATRVVEVVRHLIAAGHDVHVVTGAPDFVFTTEIQSPNLHIRKVLLDCGAVQADALTVDRLASLEKYHQTAVVPRESILATEVEWLNSIKADLVVSDVVPVACRAAADAGIRSVCVTNFSWDFIYAEYVMAAGHHHRSIVWQIAEDYSHCEFLLRLPGYCPMPAFRDVIDVPLVVRRIHKSRSEVRKELAISDDVKVVIFNFGGQVAARILQDTVSGKNYASDKLSGARRLRDAIVLGYQLQRAPGRDIGIPDWYSLAENEIGLRPVLPSIETNGNASPVESCFEDFEILHGDLQGLPDTVVFLKSLSGLDTGADIKSPEKRQLRERAAAAALFDWEEEIYVARAPGRLDVMGGIADYSGSLVLQACHVAVQRNHPSKQRLWRHGQARQLAKGQGPIPVLQIVSFGSELSNRAPTFDMDLQDLMDGDEPISYEKAYQFFSEDPSQKWAAYVAGTILVLMTELGVRFTDSISILVLLLFRKEKVFLLLHQWRLAPCLLSLLLMVENHIVGAPCGVMDQMTSACGEANKLLAMVCQPAEVKELVTIPSIYVFGGVSTLEFVTVLVGLIMDLLRPNSQSLSSLGVPQQEDDMNSDEYGEQGIELLKDEASLDYLYEAVYAKNLPESITGETFVKHYADHNDTVTVIDPKRSYCVKAPTRHPIYENFRVEAFKALLTAANSDEQLSALGELMYQCHYSYNDCGLGSDGTDRLVKLVQEMQHRKSLRDGSPSLFGAKITGGGSGGSVCVIGRNCIRSSEEILDDPAKIQSCDGLFADPLRGLIARCWKVWISKTAPTTSSPGSI
ncbi:L-arabinokinase [Ananas comosus]|uniref:L-arabinokinase n=1 Tax=Ananas comosus TaxID=4615 RepID=A0A199UTA4_ANACO|nr:L-arabinokinase [Ananas comosus]